MIDGKQDYSGYSKDQLIDVLGHIDRQRFPLNYAHAVRRLEALPQQSDSPHVSSAETRRGPATNRGTMVAEATQFEFAPLLYFKYSIAHLVATFVVGSLISEAYALIAQIRHQKFDPAALLHNLIFTVAGCGAALLIYFLLAKRHARGYFISGSIVSLLSAALGLGVSLLVAPTYLKLVGVSGVLAGVATDLCMVGLAGWLCGLAPFRPWGRQASD